MSLSEFETKYVNQGIDFDGAFGNQCVDLMNRYLVDCLGIKNPIQTLPGATAFEIYQNASSPLFDKIDNTPDGIPSPGDIVFWNTTIGSAGHVAVFIHGDQNSFTSFDQNFPTGSLCHEQGHDYTGVAGWLHPKQALVPTMTLDDQTFKKLVGNSTALDLLCDYLVLPHNSPFPDIQKKLDAFKQTVSDLEAEGVKLNQQVSDTLKQAEQFKQDDSNLGLRNLDLGHTVDALQGSLRDLYASLGVSSQHDALSRIDALKKPQDDTINHFQKILKDMWPNLFKGRPRLSFIDRLWNWLK